MRLLFTIVLLSGFVLSAFSQSVRIGLCNDLDLKSIVVSYLKGRYQVFADSALLMELPKDDALYVSMYGTKLLVRNSQEAIGTFGTIKITEVDTGSVFRMMAVTPKSETHQYANSLTLSVAYGRIMAINEAQVDNYVSGVVEAETGPNALPELYKAQAVLVRTFLYGHIGRHGSEGFDLCDGVHCQAFKGRAIRNLAVVAATKATAGQVVLAPDSTFITAFFHANCGGETESAYNAWLSGKSYLIPVKDPFCLNSPGAQWIKKVPIEQWSQYLKAHGFKLPKKFAPIGFDITQINRKQYYRIGKDSIPMKQIRNDFQLRSTFFSVIASEKEITLKGKGYGHGVGMCQEGAIQMAKIGYKYDEILNYYFKGIRLSNLSGVRPAK